MRRTVLLIGLGAMLAACTVEQQARWQATVTQIREGVRVSTEAARAVLDEVCAQGPAIQLASSTAIGIAESRRGPGANPRTDALIRDINTGMAAFQAACTSGSAATTSLANLAVRAWSAYQAVIAAQAAARA